MSSFLSQQIIYEDRHLIIVNKTCSQLVQGDSSGDITLIEMIKQLIKVRDSKSGNVFCGLVHRLDRPSSGIVVFAKTSKALSRMNDIFRKGEVRKTYWALVEKPPPANEGKLRHYLIKNTTQNKSYAFEKPGRGRKESYLHYNLKKKLKTLSLLEIKLLTGRHHQIRAQLAKIGVCICGDLKYGAGRSNLDGGISLHARNISFSHPITHEVLNLHADPRSNGSDSLWARLPLDEFYVTDSDKKH